MPKRTHETVMICAECGTEIVYEVGTVKDSNDEIEPYIKPICPTCDKKGGRAVCFAPQRFGYNVYVNVKEFKEKLN